MTLVAVHKLEQFFHHNLYCWDNYSVCHCYHHSVTLIQSTTTDIGLICRTCICQNILGMVSIEMQLLSWLACIQYVDGGIHLVRLLCKLRSLNQDYCTNYYPFEHQKYLDLFISTWWYITILMMLLFITIVESISGFVIVQERPMTMKGHDMLVLWFFGLKQLKIEPRRPEDTTIQY